MGRCHQIGYLSRRYFFMKMATPVEVLPSRSMLFFSFLIKISTIIWKYQSGPGHSQTELGLANCKSHATSVPMSSSTLSPSKRQRPCSTEHRCVSGFWSCSLITKYHRAIFTRVGSHLERWAACVVPALVLICTLVRVHAPSSQRERQFHPSILDERLLPTLHSGAIFSISASEGKCLAKA